LLILAVFTKTPPVFFAPPLASPSVLFFVTVFVRPACSTLLLFFPWLNFNGKKPKAKSCADPAKQKPAPKNKTPSYLT